MVNIGLILMDHIPVVLPWCLDSWWISPWWFFISKYWWISPWSDSMYLDVPYWWCTIVQICSNEGHHHHRGTALTTGRRPGPLVLSSLQRSALEEKKIWKDSKDQTKISEISTKCHRMAMESQMSLTIQWYSSRHDASVSDQESYP